MLSLNPAISQRIPPKVPPLNSSPHPRRGICTQAPCFSIVMEYCPYGQLYEVLRDGKNIPAKLLYDWAKQLAQGQRDMTPSLTINLKPSLTFSLTTNLTISLTPILTISLTIRLTPILTIRLTPSLTVNLTPSLTIRLTPSLTIRLTPSLTIRLTPSLTINLTPSLTISSIPCLTPMPLHHLLQCPLHSCPVYAPYPHNPIDTITNPTSLSLTATYIL